MIAREFAEMLGYSIEPVMLYQVNKNLYATINQAGVALVVTCEIMVEVLASREEGQTNCTQWRKGSSIKDNLLK